MVVHTPSKPPSMARVFRGLCLEALMLQSRLSRFTGASAISSADFYGEEDDEGRQGRGRRNNFDIENMNATELMSRLSVQVTTAIDPLMPCNTRAFVLRYVEQEDIHEYA